MMKDQWHKCITIKIATPTTQQIVLSVFLRTTKIVAVVGTAVTIEAFGSNPANINFITLFRIGCTLLFKHERMERKKIVQIKMSSYI